MPETVIFNHYASGSFWYAYRQLPDDIQVQADKQFERLKQDPHYPSLRFQPKTSVYWAARVSRGYRALARYMGNGDFLWVWIGTHREYERLLRIH